MHLARWRFSSFREPALAGGWVVSAPLFGVLGYSFFDGCDARVHREFCEV